MNAMAAALALLADPTGQAGFQGFVLGQSLHDARAVPLPRSEYDQRRLVCTDEAKKPTGLRVSEGEAGAGLVRCWPAEHIGSSFVRSGLPISGTAEATVELEFVGGKLIAIETVYDALHASSISDALRLKYGKPHREARGEVQNQLGGRFDQSVTTWTVGAATIELRSPEYSLRRMAVSYVLPEALGFRARIREAEAEKMKL